MRDRWRELLETLAEELFGPAGRGRSVAGTAERSRAAGLLSQTIAETPLGHDPGAAETRQPNRTEGLVGALASLAGRRQSGRAGEETGLDGGNIGAAWLFRQVERLGGGTDLGSPAEGGQQDPVERQWGGPAGEVSPPVPFPGAVDDAAQETAWMRAARPRSETAAVTAEALDRAFQRDARRYDGGFPLY